MIRRPFSNNKIITYTDYTNKKKNNCKRIYKNKQVNSYSELLFLKQKCVNNCRSLYPCIKAPITLIQANNSYICNPNINNDEDSCKILKQTLYPYGYYLCKNTVCNTCVNTPGTGTMAAQTISTITE